jgi:hypothetical protein
MKHKKKGELDARHLPSIYWVPARRWERRGSPPVALGLAAALALGLAGVRFCRFAAVPASYQSSAYVGIGLNGDLPPVATGVGVFGVAGGEGVPWGGVGPRLKVSIW